MIQNGLYWWGSEIKGRSTEKGTQLIKVLFSEERMRVIFDPMSAGLSSALPATEPPCTRATHNQMAVGSRLIRPKRAVR